MTCRWFAFAPLLLSLMLAAPGRGLHAAAEPITTPTTFFGFEMGADRKMARWDKMVEYYRRLEKESPKLKVVDMGPSTIGHPSCL